MKVEELKNYLKLSNRDKKRFGRLIFAASKNGVQPLRKAIEIESDLVTDYKNKLKIDDFPIPDPYKIPLMGRWKKMKEWHFDQCYHTQIYLIF